MKEGCARGGGSGARLRRPAVEAGVSPPQADYGIWRYILYHKDIKIPGTVIIQFFTTF